MAMPLLQIEDLHVSFQVYGGTLKVLNGVNLTLRKGEKVGLVGETGCGKTTTVKSVMRILPIPPAQIIQGQIYFKGKNLLEVNLDKVKGVRGEGIAMIFQDPTAALNPVFTVGEQLGDVIRYSKRQGEGQSRGVIRNQAVSTLKDMNMPDPERILENYPTQLSGGMRQRVCIGMALITARELLIADEPGTSLDVTIQDQILRLLREMVEEKNTSIILITHTLGVVREWTDRVYVMYAGTIVENAKTSDLFSHPLHPYTRGLMTAVPKLTGEGIAEGIKGRIPNYLNPPSGCRFHPRCDHKLPSCSRERPPLLRVDHSHEVACFLYSR